MKIEAGKYYRTRDGRKAWVAAQVPNDMRWHYRFVGVLEDDAEAWTDAGRWWTEGNHHDNDLVAEWREPVSVVIDIVLLADGRWDAIAGKAGEPHVFRDVPNTAQLGRIRITEGKGIEVAE